MTRKRKTKRRRTGINPSSSQVGHRIKRMAAEGLVEDQIAARLSLDKNQLRRRHIDDIKAGRAENRQAQAATEGEDLTEKEETMRRAYLAGYGTDWENPDGTCDLHHGNTLEQQKKLFAEWLRKHRGGKQHVTYGDPG